MEYLTIPPELWPANDPVRLSTGRVAVFVRAAHGGQDVTPNVGPREFTPSEWQEVEAAVRAPWRMPAS